MRILVTPGVGHMSLMQNDVQRATGSDAQAGPSLDSIAAKEYSP